MCREGMKFCVVVSFVMLTGASRAADWGDGLVAEQAHDFGRVPRGAVVRHNFTLRNGLDGPVEIREIHASCGCTTAKAAGSVIPPGGSLTVEAEMDTKNFVGEKSTVVFVTLRGTDGKEAEVRLAVRSEILGEVVLSPGTVDFGMITRGRSVTQTMAIERIGQADWKVQRMVSACRAIDGSMTESTRSAKLVSYTVKLTLRADAPVGLLREHVVIKTNDPNLPTIEIPVVAQVRGELTGTPSLLGLGPVISTDGVNGRYLLRASRPFKVRSVGGTGDGFSVSTDDAQAKPVHVLTVAYHPEGGRSRGDLRKTFTVQTDLAGEPALELIATARVEP